MSKNCMWCQRPMETPQLRKLLELREEGDGISCLDPEFYDHQTLMLEFLHEKWPLISEALRHTSNETAEKILKENGATYDPKAKQETARHAIL